MAYFHHKPLLQNVPECSRTFHFCQREYDTGVVDLRNIDMRDLALLAELKDGNHCTKISGMQAQNFHLDRKTNTIYKRLKRLESNGYICRGFRIANSETFYITPEGVNTYLEAKNEGM